MKAINQMLSSIILIVVVVASAVVVSNWLGSLSKETTRDITGTAKERLSCQFANMYIKNVSYYCNNNCNQGVLHNLTLTVVNSGKKPVMVDKIYVENSTGGLFTFEIGNVQINASDIVQIINSSTSSCHGINRSIENVIISRLNCPSDAFASYPGWDVIFVGC